ncbi:MAG: 3-dehydroquinate synthase [Phycisphaerales bacterium]|nr:3-dehydroquinate synthase [Phycisphaerales bacterium]
MGQACARMMPADTQPRTVRVDLADRGYDVVIGPGLLETLPQRLDAMVMRPRAAFIVADANVADASGRCRESLERSGIAVGVTTIHATEPGKSIATLAEILRSLGEARIERGEPVVAIGGGITGDLGGFAAAVYRRGVPVIQCPTTLLAMVDASVGGKTGANLAIGDTLQKNMVGAFHQPSLVLADTRTLGTLPDREFKAGLAECLKHALLGGCLGDTDHLGWFESNTERVLRREADAVAELIHRSVAFKAAVVAGDEFELAEDTPGRVGRALLNLGHTFAHAMETLKGASPAGRPADSPLLHGEAVALGLLCAAETSAALGLIDRGLGPRIARALEACGLPTRAAGLPDAMRLLSLMGADKKTSGGRLRLVLPTPGCTARVVVSPEVSAVEAGWAAIKGA